MFRLSITAADLVRRLTDPDHPATATDPDQPATATGHVHCDVLGVLLPVERGWHHLFTRDDDPRRRRTQNRPHLRAPGGNPRRNRCSARTLSSSEQSASPWQLTTFRSEGPHTVRVLERFKRLFPGELWPSTTRTAGRAREQGSGMNVSELREHATRLGFTPQEAVRWLAPRELVRTAVKVMLADVFADYSDKREIQGSLDAELLHAPLGRPDATELWIDYVADLGDGFDATSSVAWSLAADEITVEGTGGVPSRLTRGSLLVLGGDEVYPAASATAYEDRMKGPYRAALPAADDRPLMVALPGNHDWYDGLTAFLRMFAQQHAIGGWQTAQTRSYFCVRLPERWWLVGLDSQLGSYLDAPQLRYFETHLSANLRPGDGVVVCSAKPTWVESAEHDADAFNALHWFDRNYVRTRVDPRTGQREETHASIRLWLTGDKHHYARYAERLPGDPPGSGELPPDPRRGQMVTCGMGGAYLGSTETLPAVLPLPSPASRMREKDNPPREFVRGPVTSPGIAESRRIAWGIAQPWGRRWLPRRNPGFAELTAGVHAVLFLLLGYLLAFMMGLNRPVPAVRAAGAGDLGGFAALCAAAAVVPPVIGRLRRLVRGRPRRPSSGTTAAVLLQFAVALAILAVVVALPFPASWPGWLVLAVCLAVAGVLGALVGSEVFALWMMTRRRGAVADWQMSGQSIEERKGFLRLHIAPGGDLTLYPLALDRICRDWHLVEDPGGDKRPAPADPPAVRLIEDPIVIAREAPRHERRQSPGAGR
ncbi:metallophosphoesterase [Streptomyces cavernae]|uniref:metallophosphoesterase n=1 Tax=Streptomyces cavernae TaxID=2259034 RepID=UPI000FEBFAE1|nr:metallophosphoesterase [Streptomyces cavernae]